jgi:hypothetical protein
MYATHPPATLVSGRGGRSLPVLVRLSLVPARQRKISFPVEKVNLLYVTFPPSVCGRVSPIEKGEPTSVVVPPWYSFITDEPPDWPPT